ncbi:MAG: aspartate kinase [Clostridia bacterium]|nr:aspartate kinase [Clostridia bacterium]MBQ2274991.1 aspartate kinase [Clostridia bacterium]MEE1278078.1 aspartate kinase [Acutalibacteraceae bacterium]
MALIVKKFGGSSVANNEKLLNVAKIIEKDYKAGNDVIVVVSAQGDTTDELLEKAYSINPKGPSKRELDMLVSAGEQMSISLLAMTIETLGLPVVSLLGWQAGFTTDSNYSIARIRKIDPERIRAELAKKNIVIVAGFQGLNKYDDITTLGRGGSDTSAVAIASVLKADLCQIYTDVDGVYTADPRIVKTAKKMNEITYDEMLELATLGAQVLNNRSVEMAKKYGIELEVLSSLTPEVKGTIVKEVVGMEKMLIRGVAKDSNVSRISIVGLQDQPGVAFKVFERLAQAKVNVDIILQSVGRDGTKDITFTVTADQCNTAIESIKKLEGTLNYKKLVHDESVCKVSIVGTGMQTHPGVAAKMFEALSDADINIQTISTSEIKISVLVDTKQGERALNVVHDAFML